MFRSRSFLKSSSLIAGGLILPKLSFKSKKNNRKKLKIAVVGCGGRGTGAAVQALRADNNVELVTLADAFKDRLETSLNAIKDEFEGEMEINIKEKHKFVTLSGLRGNQLQGTFICIFIRLHCMPHGGMAIFSS